MKAGEVGALLVRDVNRLARDELVSQRIYQVLEEHRVRLITPQMEYDWGNLQHRLMLGLLGSIEAYAKRWLTMNMKRARHTKKARGEWGNAASPYGYKWQSPDRQARIPGRPVAVHEEIATVLQIFHLCVSKGLSCLAIAEHLRQTKVPTRKKNSRWTGGQVRTILRAPCYKGEWYVDRAGKVRSKEFTEAVVDPKMWAKAQRVIDGHKRHHGPSTKRDFLLSHLAFCECGSAMGGRYQQHGTDGQQTYVYYVCDAGSRDRHRCPATYIRAATLDEPVWAMVEELARDPEQIKKLVAATKKDMLPEWKRQLRYEQRSLADQKLEWDRARLAYRKGIITLEAFADEKKDIDAETADLQSRIAHLEQLISGEEIRQEAADRIATEMQAVAGRLDSDEHGRTAGPAAKAAISSDGNAGRQQGQGRVRWGALPGV